MSGRPVIRRGADAKFAPSRRPGIRQWPMVGPDASPDQNLVLVEADAGADVELHPVPNSESFHVLAGELEVFGEGYRERLTAGDTCLFPAGHAHGVKVGGEPARFLVVFAPARG